MIVYKYDTQTKEFTQELKINKAYGTNLPFTTTVKPLTKKDGFATVFNGAKWEYIEDNRNKTVYIKATREELKVDYLGKIKDEHTLLVPKQFDKWDEDTQSWIEDTKAKEDNRILSVNSYTQNYILKKYPIEKQSSANLGIYDEEYKNEMILFIQNIIEKSNLAITNGISFEDFKEILNNG
ncbi:hypothetical protein [Aliarcobacter lanthieri]|uniref:hypothetical protein n=1 Tax=Aliarcobacter lanthieri TaxID=1355374 RepID=UPI0004B7BF2B|nr:hypothetical protein [Aliarcobacter lanthieri]